MPIVDAVHKGVFTANRKYEAWTRGEQWICDAGVEGFLAAEISAAIHETQYFGQSLQMEVTVGHIAELAGVEHAPLPAGLQGDQRIDIVLFNKRKSNKYAVCPIEVKRKFAGDGVWRDLVRIRNLIVAFGPERHGSVRRGYAAIFFAGRGGNVQGSMDRAKQDILDWQADPNYANELAGVTLAFHQCISPCGMFDPDPPGDFDGVEYQFGSMVIEVNPGVAPEPTGCATTSNNPV